MTGVTIDHMVSLAVLITVLTVSIIAYSQIIGSAVTYQQNQQVGMKAAELINTISLNPGSPNGWGQVDSAPSAFGLQDSDTGGYSLSPFSLERLSSSQVPVYYSKTGLWYSNNSLGGGGSLYVPLHNVVNYTTSANLLGVNGYYGFRLTIMPTLNVSISEVYLNPLKLNVAVIGPSLAVPGATLNYFLYYAIPHSQYPSIQAFPGTAQTNSTGLATLQFSSVDGSKYAYSIIVYARLSGLSGVGYRSRGTSGNNNIIPFVRGFQNGTVLLAHSWDVHSFPSPAALYFNATFLSLTSDFQLRQIPLAVSTGFVKNGSNFPVQIPTQGPGILFVVYQKSQTECGVVMMPWGISPLGFSLIFGGNPSNADWVATELRQITVSKVSYQARLAVWSTKGYQSTRYNP
jgi:hypothetical protein